MREDEFSKLLQRYLSAHEAGKDPYFDADEIDMLLDHFEDTENFTYYKGVLNAGLKLYPLDADLKIRECKYYLYKDDHSKALLLADNILENNNIELDLVRLECYCGLNRYNDVVRYVSDLTENHCEYLQEIYESTAQMLDDYEMTGDALDFINHGLILFPGNFILRNELCYVWETEGEYEKAIKLCNELIDESPYSYDLWFMLGRLHLMSANYDKAIDAFDFALACDDSDPELKMLKAYCLTMNENYLKAIEIYNEIAENKDFTYRVKPLMADCYICLEEYETAYNLFEEAEKISPDELDITSLINFIRCCLETDREQEAFRLMVKAVNQFPENIRVLSLLALSYLDKGNEEMALSITNRILKQLDMAGNNIFFPDIHHKPIKPEKYIPIKDLTKEYLNNKDNNN